MNKIKAFRLRGVFFSEDEVGKAAAVVLLIILLKNLNVAGYKFFPMQ